MSSGGGKDRLSSRQTRRQMFACWPGRRLSGLSVRVVWVSMTGVQRGP